MAIRFEDVNEGLRRIVLSGRLDTAGSERDRPAVRRTYGICERRSGRVPFGGQVSLVYGYWRACQGRQGGPGKGRPYGAARRRERSNHQDARSDRHQRTDPDVSGRTRRRKGAPAVSRGECRHRLRSRSRH